MSRLVDVGNGISTRDPDGWAAACRAVENRASAWIEQKRVQGFDGYHRTQNGFDPKDVRQKIYFSGGRHWETDGLFTPLKVGARIAVCSCYDYAKEGSILITEVIDSERAKWEWIEHIDPPQPSLWKLFCDIFRSTKTKP